jgi:hypothetical protein
LSCVVLKYQTLCLRCRSADPIPPHHSLRHHQAASNSHSHHIHPHGRRLLVSLRLHTSNTANMLVTSPAGVAMPIIKTLSDCASYSTTVEPYIPQLYALPEKILANIGDLEALKNIYTTTNPVISGFAFSLALFPIFLIVSEVNRNWSQVDRVWSILPTLYHVHYAVWARTNGLETQRVDNVMAFSILWSCRLTFNYWRRGGYQIGSEDYRWNLIKGWIGTPAFFVLNVLFTSSVQSVSSSLPAHIPSIQLKNLTGPPLRRHNPNLPPPARLPPAPHHDHHRNLFRALPRCPGRHLLHGRPTTMELPQSESRLPAHRQTPTRLLARSARPRLQHHRPVEILAPPKLRCRANHLGHVVHVGRVLYGKLVELDCCWASDIFECVCRQHAIDRVYFCGQVS